MIIYCTNEITILGALFQHKKYYTLYAEMGNLVIENNGKHINITEWDLICNFKPIDLWTPIENLYK